jgi:hypothetical protein
MDPTRKALKFLLKVQKKNNLKEIEIKDERHGQHLWSEWGGNGYNEQLTSSTVYYTFDHIDLENDLVRRALASALQRDGVAVSLGDGFNMIDKATPIHGWSGLIEEELDFTVCDDSGETEYGDIVGVALATTWVEI